MAIKRSIKAWLRYGFRFTGIMFVCVSIYSIINYVSTSSDKAVLPYYIVALGVIALFSNITFAQKNYINLSLSLGSTRNNTTIGMQYANLFIIVSITLLFVVVSIICTPENIVKNLIGGLLCMCTFMIAAGIAQICLAVMIKLGNKIVPIITFVILMLITMAVVIFYMTLDSNTIQGILSNIHVNAVICNIIIVLLAALIYGISFVSIRMALKRYAVEN